MDKAEFLELLKDREVVEAIRAALAAKRPYVKKGPGDWVVEAGDLLKGFVLSNSGYHDRWFKSSDVFNDKALFMDPNYAKIESTLHVGRGLRHLADQGLLRVSSAGKGLMKFRYDTGIND